MLIFYFIVLIFKVWVGSTFNINIKKLNINIGNLKIEILFYPNLTKYINTHNYGNPPISKFFF